MNISLELSWRAKLKEHGARTWKYLQVLLSPKNIIPTTAAFKSGSVKQNWRESTPLKLDSWAINKVNLPFLMWMKSPSKEWNRFYPSKQIAAGVFSSMFLICWQDSMMEFIFYHEPHIPTPSQSSFTRCRAKMKMNKMKNKNQKITEQSSLICYHLYMPLIS